ncbi:hypothetical protein RF11_09788 [Thelohanellus kitauei]|uniref:DDE-1 domain-containing protein n=1 Tax=Thelohanellus kitauei TaxID=669202 RepID=A0A0C2JJ16_THEKT|nr:hypothetical protein RF11_09788 [Thelohanellus kitauei]
MLTKHAPIIVLRQIVPRVINNCTIRLEKKAMDRITVLCCTNMSGTDKLKLLIIGKRARPRRFKMIRMAGLPDEYHALPELFTEGCLSRRLTISHVNNVAIEIDVKLEQ